jgi:serine protease Do
MKAKYITLFFLIVLNPLFAQAQFSPRLIAENYNEAVVKILMYDPVLAQISDHAGVLSRGSGFIVTNDGLVFTNKHVISEAIYGYLIADCSDNTGKTYDAQFIGLQDIEKLSEAEVTFSKFYHVGYCIPLVQQFYGDGPDDYKLYQAEVLTYSDAFDGAMVHIIADLDGNKTSGVSFASTQLGDSDKAAQGDRICILGFPAQYSGGVKEILLDRSTLTTGYHSGLDYVFDKDYGMIKTDANVNSGNSGGPAFGEDNTVIGIASAVGVQTKIGLLSGINGMYYVAAPYNNHFRKLMEKGLTTPARANVISTKKYQTPDLPSAEALNLLIEEIDKQTAEPVKVTVTITVKSADTGRPLSGANGVIMIENEKTGNFEAVSKATSQKDGTLNFFPEVEAGKQYKVVVTVNKYRDFSGTVEITETKYKFNISMARQR